MLNQIVAVFKLKEEFDDNLAAIRSHQLQAKFAIKILEIKIKNITAEEEEGQEEKH